MSRVKRAVARNARRKKILKLAKGYRGRSKNNLRLAIERVEKGLQYAYRCLLYTSPSPRDRG